MKNVKTKPKKQTPFSLEIVTIEKRKKAKERKEQNSKTKWCL